MNDWKIIKTQEDIDELINAYVGFHDSCIVRADYSSGNGVIPDGFMSDSPSEAHELNMVFNSPWYETPLALRFSGVRRFLIGGYEENYFPNIFDCYLNIHQSPEKGTPLIVWANTEDFEPEKAITIEPLNEPCRTFVIADNLMWRFIDDDN